VLNLLDHQQRCHSDVRNVKLTETTQQMSKDQPICGYCSENNLTKSCTNLQNPPKCNTCDEQHPTYSFKCKGKPKPNAENNMSVVPLRIPEPNTAQVNNSSLAVPTTEQIIQFITLTLQNLYPFNKETILFKIQQAAQQIFKVKPQTTYSSHHVFFSFLPFT